MATATLTYLLDDGAEYSSWDISSGTNVTASHDTTTADADATGSAGQASFAITTKNKNSSGYMRKLLAWTDIGVPANGTVTHVRVQYSERQSINTASSNSDTGPFELRDSTDSSTDLTLITLLNRTTTSTYASRDSGTVALASSEAASVQHYFKLNHRLQTSNTTGASVTHLHDWIIITATYTTPEPPSSSTKLLKWFDDDL